LTLNALANYEKKRGIRQARTVVRELGKGKRRGLEGRRKNSTKTEREVQNQSKNLRRYKGGVEVTNFFSSFGGILQQLFYLRRKGQCSQEDDRKGITPLMEGREKTTQK